MLRGRRIPLAENEKVFWFSRCLGILVPWFLSFQFLGFLVSGFKVTRFLSFNISKFHRFNDPRLPNFHFMFVDSS